MSLGRSASAFLYLSDQRTTKTCRCRGDKDDNNLFATIATTMATDRKLHPAHQRAEPIHCIRRPLFGSLAHTAHLFGHAQHTYFTVAWTPAIPAVWVWQFVPGRGTASRTCIILQNHADLAQLFKVCTFDQTDARVYCPENPSTPPSPFSRAIELFKCTRIVIYGAAKTTNGCRAWFDNIWACKLQ